MDGKRICPSSHGTLKEQLRVEGEVSLQFFFFPFSSLCPTQQTHELDDATIDLSGNTCGIYKIKDIEAFLVYSKASRYMASSCKNFTGARF